MRRFLVLACLVVSFLVFRSGIASGMPPVQRSVLANGLVLLVSEEHSLPFVTFHLLVKTGSKNDPAGAEGLADLTAAGLLLGAGSRTMTQIHEDLDFTGARITADANKDFTDVSLVTLKKDIDAALPIFMDALLKPTFPAAEVKKEISRALGALRSSEDQPSVVAERAFNKSLYENGPYGHPVEGTKESVSKITAAQLGAFHRAYFHPNNSILVVVGDIDERTLKERVLPAFEKWQQKPLPPERPETAPAGKKERVEIDKPVTQATVVMGNPGMSRDNPDYYTALVMNYILGGGSLTSRLMEEIRVKKGLVYSVDSFFAAQKGPGSFQVVLQTKAASTMDAIQGVENEIRRIRTELVSPQELEDAKKYLIGSFSQRFSSQSKIAAFFSQVEYFGLGLDYPEKYSGIIGAVTREDILRVAQEYVHPEILITVIVADLKAIGASSKEGKAP